MPWQRFVVDVGCEIDPETGLPAYSEVFFTTPRQSGKTLVQVVWQIDRCLSWGHPQRTVFTAQTGRDARDKWLDEIIPMITSSKLAPLVEDINRGIGNESIRWRTGSLIRILSTSSTAGHSKTLDQAVMDEIWHDTDDRREQGLRPAMITRPDRQLLLASTAGTGASILYNRKVEAGRQAVQDDTGAGIAYFEWSAPEDWDASDQESWWTFMPALGRTIDPKTIEQERQSMAPSEFLRAYGNRPTAGQDLIIPMDAWRRVCSIAAKPEGRLRFGLDVADDRASAAIAVASSAGVVEVVDHRQGTAWIVDRCNELTDKYHTTMAVDGGGPAGSFLDSLKNPEKLNSRQVLEACATFYDAVMAGRLTIREDKALEAAVTGAVKKTVGDTWVWSRRASTADVTPLMAATLAFGAPVRRARLSVATT